MNDLIIIAIIVALAPTIAAITALIVGVHNLKRTTEVKHELNSRLTELVDAVKKVAYSEGRADEKLDKKEIDERDQTNP